MVDIGDPADRGQRSAGSRAQRGKAPIGVVRDRPGGTTIGERMFLAVAIALICVVSIAVAIFVMRPHPPAFAPSKDVPGVRSALLFERLPGAMLEDGEVAPD